jgi:hypothetical protein
LKVFGVDAGENLIFVEGAVPGSNGTFVLISDAVKKVQDKLPVPTVAGATEEVAAAEAETVNEAEQA